MRRRIQHLKEEHDLTSDDDDVSGEEDDDEPNTEQSDSLDVEEEIILSESGKMPVRSLTNKICRT